MKKLILNMAVAVVVAAAGLWAIVVRNRVVQNERLIL